MTTPPPNCQWCGSVTEFVGVKPNELWFACRACGACLTYVCEQSARCTEALVHTGHRWWDGENLYHCDGDGR